MIDFTPDSANKSELHSEIVCLRTERPKPVQVARGLLFAHRIGLSPFKSSPRVICADLTSVHPISPGGPQ
eukprot:11192485-Lingulodinium_polyedra.AAC.1